MSLSDKLEQGVIHIKEAYDHDVKVSRVPLVKFGRNDDLGTSVETVWLVGGDETLPTTNAIDKISSSDAGDTEVVKVIGHIFKGTDLHPFSQNVTLAGQTETALGTAMARVNRVYVTSDTVLAGNIYVYEDDTVTSGVPQTAAKIHIKTGGDYNQSMKAATAIDYNQYLLVTSITGGVTRAQTRSVDFDFQVKEPGGTYRTKFPFSANSSSGTVTINFEAPLVVPPNSDIRVRAVASGVSTGVDATITGYYAYID